MVSVKLRDKRVNVALIALIIVLPLTTTLIINQNVKPLWTLGPTRAPATAEATGPTGVTNNSSVTLTYSHTKTPTSVKLYYTKNANITWTLAGEDTSVDDSYAYTITSGDGTYGWIAVAIGGGSTETDPPVDGTSAEAYGLTLDTTAPTTTDNAPTGWQTTTITVTLTATDATSGVAHTYYKNWLMETPETTYVEGTTVTISTDGKWYIKYYSVDVATNAETAHTVEVWLDTTPSISSVNTISPYLQTTSPLTVTATASDTVSGLASVELWHSYSTDNVTFGGWTLFGTDTASPWSWSFNAPNGNGYYQFYSIAKDNASNVESAPAGTDAICGVNVAGGGLIVRSPIYINGTSNFTSANGVTSGSGTAGNPYIIENWDINASSANGIDIENTNVYFIVRNCVIHDGKSNSKNGIYFYDVINGKIDNVTSYNNYGGISFDSSSNNIITNCDVYNNYYGIWLSDSANNNTVTNCSVYNNSLYGIYLSDSSDNDNIFHHNNITNNGQNAYDPNTNYWDDGAYGNYWSDYTDVDVDGDGIGDTPYNIPSGTNKDFYPLMNPVEYAKLTTTLKKGWNFISMVIINKTIYGANELVSLIGENCTAIGYWDNSLGRFVIYYVGTSIGNFTLPRAIGYFVYVTDETQFSMEGLRMSNRTMSLDKGWNAIGALNQTSINASVLASKITNCTSVARWNDTNQAFDVYTTGDTGSDFVINYVESCLVYLISNETWINN